MLRAGAAAPAPSRPPGQEKGVAAAAAGSTPMIMMCLATASSVRRFRPRGPRHAKREEDSGRSILPAR